MHLYLLDINSNRFSGMDSFIDFVLLKNGRINMAAI
jgi:hypothetical protein